MRLLLYRNLLVPPKTLAVMYQQWQFKEILTLLSSSVHTRMPISLNPANTPSCKALGFDNEVCVYSAQI